MIKLEDIRIGNLIWNPVQQCTCKVDMAVMAKIQADAYLKSKGNEVVEFEPIPLTEQWLIDFGFNKDGNSFRNNHYMFILEWEIYTNIKHGTKLFSLGMFGNYVTHIKYVHQLQNLYFALTGEELTKK